MTPGEAVQVVWIAMILTVGFGSAVVVAAGFAWMVAGICRDAFGDGKSDDEKGDRDGV